MTGPKSKGLTVELCVPLAPLRVAASDRAEMCTQALAGESAVVINTGEGDWIEVELKADGYTGWTDAKQWVATHAPPSRSCLLQAPVSSWLREDGIQLELPSGSQLALDENDTWRLGRWALQPLDDLDVALGAHARALDAAEQFLGTPYLWGGKSLFGMDCSGLIQVAFQLTGKVVPRDACDQCQMGESVKFDDRKSGDLAFFQNSEGRVVHVGILSEPSTIIHAAGEVRLDEITQEGIFRNGTQTHTLHSIMRW